MPSEHVSSTGIASCGLAAKLALKTKSKKPVRGGVMAVPTRREPDLVKTTFPHFPLAELE
jgi:hypothetical protein